MMSIDAVHKALLSAWKSANQQQVRKQLDNMQNIIFDPTTNQAQHLTEEALLCIFKDYYEINALYFVKEGDIDQFGQAIKEVEAFYATQQSATGGVMKSEQQFLMYGLHLMYLLATNKIAEFHMLIEKIDYDKRKTDPFLDVPVKLERYLMEGAYNSMNLTEASLPSPYYKLFMSTLKQAVQNEIAIGLEMSYRNIPIKNIAMKQLFLKDENEALAFGNKRGWIRNGDEFLIAGIEATASDQKQKPTLALVSGVERILQPLDSERIIQQCLQYANQLERIV